MSKFDGILNPKDQEIIHSIFGQLHADSKTRINIIETVESIVNRSPSYFVKLTDAQKIQSFMTMAIMFDTLLDEEINPLSKKLLEKTVNVFNNNIFDVTSPSNCGCDKWDELNKCCMLERIEKVFPEVWDCESNLTGVGCNEEIN